MSSPENPGAIAEIQAGAQLEQLPKKQRPWQRAAGILGNILFALIMLVMAFLVFCMVQSRLSGNPPNIAGYQMYIVLGGSMSPAFEAGSLAILAPVDARDIVKGDIITYRSGGGLTTHRVMAVHDNAGQLSFTTRGDANEVDDGSPVLAQDVIGRVVYAVPYAGYVMNFAQTKKGLTFLIIIPGLLIIFFELRFLFRYADEIEKNKKAAKAQDPTPNEQAEKFPA